MLHLSTPTSKKVVLILDDSGSMYATYHGKAFVKEIRERFDRMADQLESNEALRTSVEAVIFSCEARAGKRLMGMPELAQSTNISSGFKEMHKLASRSPCDHCIVVFISDGRDDRGNEAKIASLLPLPCKATLITVAVGEGFPTSLVVDKLRPVYHTFGGDAVPLVIELPSDRTSAHDMASDVEWAVSQVQGIVEAGGVQREYTLEELALLNDVKLISFQCKLWYNACTVKCMSKDVPHDAKVLCIRETKDQFNEAEQLMKVLVCSHSSHLKPLPSNLRARRPLFLLTSMREKLNQLLSRLTVGGMMGSMSDSEKAEYLRYGNSEGRFLHKALTYHSVDFGTSKASLLRFLAQHEATEKDAQLVDNINLCSWRDYFEDAGLNTDAFQEASSLAGILDTLPFVGRGVELHSPIPDCAQINPWLLPFMVKDLPTTLKGVSTYDLYTACSGEIKLSGGGRINAIVIGGGNPSCPGIFCHVQTFCLIKNWMAYFNDIRLVGASMLVMFVMCCSPRQEEWHLEELARARDICALHTPANSRWWIEYLDAAQSPRFRDCLVTESAQLPRYMTCPDLSKFMLATWWLVDQKCVTLHPLDLAERCQATVAEFLGRAGVPDLLPFFEVSASGPLLSVNPTALALDAVRHALRQEHLTARHILGLLKTVVADTVRSNGVCGGATVTFHSAAVKEFVDRNLSVEKIQRFFIRLAQQQYGEPCWEGLTEEQLLRALFVAHYGGRSSFQRNCINDCLFVSSESMLKRVTLDLSGSWLAETRCNMLAEGMEAVQSHLRARHNGLPRVIPAEHWLRYQAETGRDISKTWRLDEAGLSTVACCFPACELYLTIPPGSVEKQRAVIRDHLRTCCHFSIPGLHRCVSANYLLPSERIAEMVKSGAELREPFLPRDVTRRLAKGVGVYGGVPRGFATAEAFKAAALADAARAVPQKIQAAIDCCTGGDDAKFVRLIDELKASLDADAAWSYAKFKATFDAKYAAMGL